MATQTTVSPSTRLVEKCNLPPNAAAFSIAEVGNGEIRIRALDLNGFEIQSWTFRLNVTS